MIFKETLTDANGSARTYTTARSALLDESGETEYLVDHGMDITTDKKSELELQDLETSTETIREIVRSLQNSGSFSGEILNYTKSGVKIWLYLNITAVYDNAGKLINFVAMENDITLIKMAEQRLKKPWKKNAI